MERCGRYVLAEKIGQGGMGEIWLARDSTDPSAAPVAIKRLLPDCASDPIFMGMFLDEARIATRLVHPAIARMLEWGNEGGRYFLVMEHVDGVTLRALLERAADSSRPLPLALCLKIISDVAGALEHAHRLPDEIGVPLAVVHRDVSPQNIMISKTGRVKLVDFGLARARTQLQKTMPGMVKGKFGYLAPEQLGGQIDGRTDVFALGLCLYEALTGKQHFDQVDAASTVVAIQAYAEPPSARALRPEVSAEVDAILARACARDPAARWPSAGAMQGALAAALAASGQRADASALETLVAGPAKPLPAAPPSVPPEALASDVAAMKRGNRTAMYVAVFALAATLLAGLGWLASS